MIEADYRYLAESQAAGRPQFDIAPYKHPRTVKVLIPLGYLRYPEGGAEAIRRSIRRTA